MTSPKSDSKPSAADARNQLERVLANPAFMANAQRKALLRHLVEEGLAGRAEKLKGFAIAVAIFDRDGRFDAQTDPVVRLEARRLRRDLDIYYGTAGADDPVRITIPKGAYVPCFEWQQVGKGAVAPSSLPPLATTAEAADHVRGKPSERGFRHLVLPTLVGIALILGAAVGWLWNQRLNESAETATVDPQEHGATVIVLPFEALSTAADDQFLAVGLAQQLISDLMPFAGLKVYSAPASSRQSPSADPTDIGRALSVAYVVRGSVRSGPAAVRVSVQLVGAKTGEVLWSETYDRPLTPDLLDVQADLAAQMAARLGPASTTISSGSWGRR